MSGYYSPEDYEKKHGEVLVMLNDLFVQNPPVPPDPLLQDLRDWQRGEGSWETAAKVEEHEGRYHEVMDILEELFEDMKDDAASRFNFFGNVFNRDKAVRVYDWFCGELMPDTERPLKPEMIETQKSTNGFEEFWEHVLDEKIWANGTEMKRRRDLYTEQCQKDFKVVAHQAWNTGR